MEVHLRLLGIRMPENRSKNSHRGFSTYSPPVRLLRLLGFTLQWLVVSVACCGASLAEIPVESPVELEYTANRKIFFLLVTREIQCIEWHFCLSRAFISNDNSNEE